MQIRNPGGKNSDPGSGIYIPDTQHCLALEKGFNTTFSWYRLLCENVFDWNTVSASNKVAKDSDLVFHSDPDPDFLTRNSRRN